VNADAPLYQRDPEAWQAHLAEGNATQPRNASAQMYSYVTTPGEFYSLTRRTNRTGIRQVAEANEPPHQAVQRELKEELDLDIQIGSLLVIDWVSPHGPWDDLLAFIFDGGELGDEQIAELRLMDDELAAFEFCTPEPGLRQDRFVCRFSSRP
jgi:8-oxo-dGTP diphosphatase